MKSQLAAFGALCGIFVVVAAAIFSHGNWPVTFITAGVASALALGIMIG